MKRLIATAFTAITLTLTAAACGDVSDDSDEGDAGIAAVPVEGVELSAAAGRVQSATYELSFQLARGQQTTTSKGTTITAEPATPLQSR